MSGTKQKRQTPAAAALAPARNKPAAAASDTHWWMYLAALPVAAAVVLESTRPGVARPVVLRRYAASFLLPGMADAPFRAWVSGVRPILMASFWLNFQQVGSEDTYPYHLVNVLLHLVNGVLVYLAVRKLLQWARSGEQTYRRDPVVLRRRALSTASSANGVCELCREPIGDAQVYSLHSARS